MTAVYGYAHYAFMAAGSRINHDLPHRLGFHVIARAEELADKDFDSSYNNVVLDAACINSALNKSTTERDIKVMQMGLREHGTSFLLRNCFLEEALSIGPKACEEQNESALAIFDRIPA
jgi:hypothetical protein